MYVRLCFSSRSRHTRCALVTGVQTCALPISLVGSDNIGALEARDQLERLQASLARLSPKSRLVFLAHRRDGLSYKEIARQEGLSEKGVQNRMSKAIAHVSRAKARF